jgi:hypothetical protein
MPFIPGFEYDIFISYAHVDNTTLSGQPDGWIEQFYKNLQLMLAKRIGRMDIIKIWWDKKRLDGNVLFDQSIEEGIKKSAIFICLNSPGYAASAYCRQELELFYNKAQQEKAGLKIAGNSRIIQVLLNNIHSEEWPPELSQQSVFQFNDAKETEDFGETTDTRSTDYKIQLQQLRDFVWKLLTDFSKDPVYTARVNEISPEPDTIPFTVYLGEVADTLRSLRKKIGNELEKNGFNVISGIPPPDEEIAHEQATQKALDQAHLSIHLLDEYPGREIPGIPEMWFPQKQAQLAFSTDKPQLIWMPSETDILTIEDEKYQLFLQDIESGIASEKGFEFVRGSRSTVSREIIDFAGQVQAQQLQIKAEKEKVSVLLDTHFNDQLYAIDLCKFLIENKVQPFINPQEDDPRKNIDILSTRLSQVNKLIFLYGSVSREWILERMNAALQLIITNNYAIEDFFIYMAPPRKSSGEISLKQKFLKVNIIDSSNSPNVDKLVLEQFLTDLNSDAA